MRYPGLTGRPAIPIWIPVLDTHSDAIRLHTSDHFRSRGAPSVWSFTTAYRPVGLTRLRGPCVRAPGTARIRRNGGDGLRVRRVRHGPRRVRGRDRRVQAAGERHGLLVPAVRRGRGLRPRGLGSPLDARHPSGVSWPAPDVAGQNGGRADERRTARARQRPGRHDGPRRGRQGGEGGGAPHPRLGGVGLRSPERRSRRREAVVKLERRSYTRGVATPGAIFTLPGAALVGARRRCFGFGGRARG